MKKKIISVLLAMIVMMAYTPFSYAGETTANAAVPEGYTAIYTKEDLKNIKNNLSGKYILMNDIKFVLEDFIKTEEDPSRRPWEPVGASSEIPFSGEFDGNGFNVEGIICIGNSEYYSGIFGYVTGTVKNLNVVDCSISNDDSSGYETRSGGIAAVVDGGTIENCHVSGAIHSKHYSGGIAGETHNANIINCSNSGEITGHMRIGGIVGIAYDTAISGCSNCGTFTMLNIDHGNKENCGGIVAYGINTDISNCSNVSELSPNAYYSGGIAGYLSGAIRESYNTGTIRGFDSCGGIAGQLYGDIINCYNTGTVKGMYYTGGIAGRNGGEISLSYNAGEITANFVGGGVAGTLADDCNIGECYNSGTVKEVSSNYSSDLGGIVGYAYGGTIADTYNVAAISGGDTGGIAGRMDNDANIITSYNVGNVTGINSGAITGFVDNDTANIVNSVYHESTNEAPVAGNVIAGATALKTMAMYETESYENFDFVGKWMFAENSEYPFPQLRNLPMHDGDFEFGFNLHPVYVDSLDIQIQEKMAYTGSPVTPEITIKDGDSVLIENENYSVEIKDNINVGTASVIVTGMGDYEGTTELFFRIVPKAPATATANLNSALSLKGYDDIKFKWSKVEGASGYNVYFKKATASKYTFMTSTTSTSVTKKDLAAGTKYTFKVEPYYKDGETKYTSLGSKTASVYTLKKVAAPMLSKKGTKVRVKWTNINGETGYQISKAKKQTGTNVIATYKTTTGTYKDVSAVKGQKYYYKVRAYKVVDGKKVFGPWSVAKKFTR